MTSSRHTPEHPVGQDSEPPPRTRPAWPARLRRERPEVYAARHVVKAVGEVAFAVLGIGAILRSLLPRIDWGWLPDITWSWLADIDLPRIPDPLGWLVSRLWGLLPDISVPAWMLSAVRSARWWMPILIAVLVAVREVDKRRAAANDDDERSGNDSAERHGADERSGDDGHDERPGDDDERSSDGGAPGAGGQAPQHAPHSRTVRR